MLAPSPLGSGLPPRCLLREESAEIWGDLFGHLLLFKLQGLLLQWLWMNSCRAFGRLVKREKKVKILQGFVLLEDPLRRAGLPGLVEGI